ncbi:MAG: DNA repair ATPase [Pirellulaceae bacterium]|nr:DNA repair ATPase [Pirellulaceae bacterium]
MTADSLQTSTYEVQRQRLADGAAELRERFQFLNEQRAEVFGNLDTRLLATLHVTTDHNCIPRDLISLGSHLLLGYNVQFGLKTEVVPKDVFSLYRLDGEQAIEEPLSLWMDERFLRDFSDLYRYYKNTFFSSFFQLGPHYYMVFQVGKTPQDIKAFKWVVDGDKLRYLDNRSDQEIRYPEQHDFRWQRASRDQHRSGAHPHVSIGDMVFVECIGGDLTIKIEDNTTSGSGIFSEPVDNPDQTLDDAEIYSCILGNLVLLKIRPYQERDFRHFVYSVKSRQAIRLDAMRQTCTQLPDDHGIIFPGGVYLQTGSYKLFDHGLTDVLYQRTVAAPNGEDFLYQFFQPTSGTYLHLRYNLIRQEVDTPLVCHGQAFLEDGRMVTMRVHEAPQKHHALQMWRTPFVGPNYRVHVTTDSMLYTIGNRDLVRCLAECQEVLHLIDKDESYADLYVDLVKRTNDILDSYFWLDREETQRLAQPLTTIRDAATAAVDEYEKVIRVRNETAAELVKTQTAVSELLKAAERSRFESLEAFVKMLRDMRTWRGHCSGLRELRTIDLSAVEKLEHDLQEASLRIGHRCVQFLLQPTSLEAYHQRIEAAGAKVMQVKSVAQGRELEKEFQDIATALELLIETISGLQIDDLTQRTAIVDRTGDQLADLNRARSSLKAHLRDLLGGELEAEFASQSKLLDQASAGALDAADQPEKVDDALTRTMLQIEELEGRFAEHEGLLERLHEKREAWVTAFEARRIQLVEARSRRADGLVTAAQRILTGIASRVERIDDGDALRAYFVSDPMVDKVRKIADQLRQLGDSVRVEDVLGRLKTLADDALRQQRDRQELFVDGQDLIRLGQHVFAVHRQPIELTTIVRDGNLMLHLTGTQFYQPLVERNGDGTIVVPVELEQAKDLWSQSLPSESDEVYRGEKLAFDVFQQWRKGESVGSWDWRQFQAADADGRVVWLRQWMQHQYQSGYSRGVHDHDGVSILGELTRLFYALGLLKHSPATRGLAWFAWQHFVPQIDRQSVMLWVSSYASLTGALPGNSRAQADATRGLQQDHRRGGNAIVGQLRQLLRKHVEADLLRGLRLGPASAYLFDQLMAHAVSATSPSASETSASEIKASEINEPVTSDRAADWFEKFTKHINSQAMSVIGSSLNRHRHEPKRLWQLGMSLVDQALSGEMEDQSDRFDSLRDYRFELVRLIIDRLAIERSDVDRSFAVHDWAASQASASCVITGLRGDHPRIAAGQMRLQYHEFMERLTRYTDRVEPRFYALQNKKRELLHRAEQKLRASEFKARVLTSFVRNRLIDEVFLPRIGENLAKQLGSAGENKRTDRMGLLLLVSPPGYGKTTLMEYIANRLGLVFVKINGPALGHQIRSLDPAEATNAAAREEVNRINLALEMGDNVMLYLDDIQHCHTELLQKFIPLCDATRRIEGVWEGQPKTYDLRGRKVAVVMAGNPYTESGGRFQIPDMLANRADVYNLGEIIGGASQAFEQSYLENCLANNSALIPLARACREDQMALIRAAEQGSTGSLDLTSNFSSDQVSEMLSVLRKLVKVRDIVLQVNRTYIQSAAQADAYRTEPPFKLQGSYRNMNRIAEKVVAVMNDDELMTLVVSSYEQDAQTLTRDGESNLLKFRELIGSMSAAQQERWQQICYAYVESVRLGDLAGDDQALQVLKSLAAIRDGLETIRREISTAVQKQGSTTSDTDSMRDGLENLTIQLKQMGDSLVEQLARTGETLERQASQLPDQKVLVQHSVPRSMTELVRSQYQLLYDGLKHLLEQNSSHSASFERLRHSLTEVLGQYGHLQAEIDLANKAP